MRTGRRPAPPTPLEGRGEGVEFVGGGTSEDGRGSWRNWVLVTRDEGRALGYFQATVREPEACTIAYVLSPAQWGHGHAREASVALISHLFESYDVPSVEAYIDTRNEASIRLVKSLGLVCMRTIHGADEFKGSSSAEHVFSVLRSAWDPTPTDARSEEHTSELQSQ